VLQRLLGEKKKYRVGFSGQIGRSRCHYVYLKLWVLNASEKSGLRESYFKLKIVLTFQFMCMK